MVEEDPGRMAKVAAEVYETWEDRLAVPPDDLEVRSDVAFWSAVADALRQASAPDGPDRPRAE